jgi:hypothetical protein
MKRVNDGNRGYEHPADLLVGEAVNNKNLKVEIISTNDDDGEAVTVISDKKSGDKVTVVQTRED